jgi:hypothetical protein
MERSRADDILTSVNAHAPIARYFLRESVDGRAEKTVIMAVDPELTA